MNECGSHRGSVVVLALSGLALSGLTSRSAKAQLQFELDPRPRFAIGEACSAPRCLISADFDADGVDDLLVDSDYDGQSRTKSLRLLLSSPSGLRERPRIETGFWGIAGIATGDVDGDGAADLAYRSSRSEEGGRVLFGDGNGGFSPDARRRSRRSWGATGDWL